VPSGVLDYGANDGILDLPVVQVHADFVTDLWSRALVPGPWPVTERI